MAYIVEPDGEFVKQRHIFVHSWESQQEPRRVQDGMLITIKSLVKYYNNKYKYIILETQISSSDSAFQSDMYGMNDKKHISKGFLTPECAIQFKLFDSYFTL